MKTKDREPHEVLAHYADRLARFAEVARRSGISTLIVCTSYDQLTGNSDVSMRTIGNTLEIRGAAQGIDWTLFDECEEE